LRRSAFTPFLVIKAQEMSNTPNLILPYIDAAQAQKHVTHNAALTALDAQVQLSVFDRTLTAPPASPVDGERHLIASGATGAWAGKDFNIAAYQSGAWNFCVPREGWLCWVAAETKAFIYTAGAWADFLGTSTPSAAVTSAHGAKSEMKILEEELTLTGANVTSTIAIPNGSICYGVSERVTLAVTGATSFKVGISGETNKFGDLLGLSLGSTNFGIIGPTAFSRSRMFYAGTPMIVTAIGSNFTGGKVRMALSR
jgi:hypothetical protein